MSRFINASLPQKLFGGIFGSSTSFSLENRLFNAATIICCITGIVAIIWNIVLDLPVVVNAIIAGAILIYLVLYYFARFKQKFNSHLIVAISLPALSLVWITSGGSAGSTPMVYLVTLIVFIGVSKARYHLSYFILIAANIIILFIIEFRYYDTLIVPYTSEEIREKDMLFGYAICGVLVFLVVRYLKLRYEAERLKLENQRIELQELNATKDKFFSILSHDLRSPFNSIIGFTELMADETKDLKTQDFRKYARVIKGSAEYAYDLLENLLNWARLNRGQLPNNPKFVNIKSTLAKCIKAFSEPSASKNLKIQNEISPDLRVFVDSNMLDCIFRNLISNAIKFSNEEGVIKVVAEIRDKQKVMISIRDSGIGMTKDLVKELFNTKADTGRLGTKGEPSHGLGLILSRELVLEMNGEIWVESVAQEGSTFHIVLPTK